MSTGKIPIVTKELSTIILAAGKGKRMYAKTPKVLHEILGKPIILFVVDLTKSIESDEIIIVVGKNGQKVKQVAGTSVKYAIQSVPRGTGDAAKKGIEISKNKNILILCGDVPLLQADTLFNLLRSHSKTRADLTFLTCEVKNPFGYGRIIRDKQDNVLRIIEESDTTAKEKRIKEINTGIYYGCRNALLSALGKINARNRQGEFYLTDVVREMIKERRKVVGVKIKNEEEIMGINSKGELAKAREIVKIKWFDQLLSRGVYIEDPSSTTIDLSVQIGKFVRIRPNTIIEGNTQINEGMTVGPFAWIKNGKKMNTVRLND